MVTLALLSILLWVHQTDTTYLKIYGLVLNHVCVSVRWEKMYDSHILRSNCMNFYRMYADRRNDCRLSRRRRRRQAMKNQQQQTETIG